MTMNPQVDKFTIILIKKIENVRLNKGAEKYLKITQIYPINCVQSYINTINSSIHNEQTKNYYFKE